ncbi:hypothetical protein HMPREF0766_13061 [Sphingobacterium spiritivorum ATCC 33861]|uniref:Uncharacterized protein n=1 Tax=Sphingobacterium spiritivorum ATCC 33861 TaxID=525373 RepID=D7VQ07_SPHSI|nr:hypothetical protein HMPREF0766_13061 [Sphingobacterium spiritivorum ATCC 33861]
MLPLKKSENIIGASVNIYFSYIQKMLLYFMENLSPSKPQALLKKESETDEVCLRY